MNRGDIYLANLNGGRGSEQVGIRPVFILYNQNSSPTCIVIPLTKADKEKGDKTHILIYSNNRLMYDSTVLIEQTRVVDKSRLKKYLCSLSSKEVKKILNKVRENFIC